MAYGQQEWTDNTAVEHVNVCQVKDTQVGRPVLNTV